MAARAENSFVDLFMRGKLEWGRIDEFVDLWHGTKGDQSLMDFLGFSSYEYNLFLSDPRVLRIHFEAKRNEGS